MMSQKEVYAEALGTAASALQMVIDSGAIYDKYDEADASLVYDEYKKIVDRIVERSVQATLRAGGRGRSLRT